MTVLVSSTNPVAFVSGKDVRITAPVVPNVTTDDIFLAHEPGQTVTQIVRKLSMVKVVANGRFPATTTGTIPLYTVPAKSSFMLNRMVFALTSISGTGTGPEIDLGYTGSFKQFIDGDLGPNLFAGVDSIGQLVSVRKFSDFGEQSGAYNAVLIAGETLAARLRNPATYSVYELRYWVFGFLEKNTASARARVIIPSGNYGRGPYGIGLYGEI